MDPLQVAFKETTLLAASGGAGVRVRWLGTAGFELTHGHHTVLFDPYLTRASLGRCLTARLQPDEAVLAKHLPKADAIVLGHTHFDHAMDAPSIAKRTGARVFGSRSASHLCRAAGVPEAQIQVVEGSAVRVHEVGPFELIFHPSAHSPLVLGRVPFEGEIADCDVVPERAKDYLCGAVFGVEVRVAGKRIFHVGSAEIIPSIPRLEVDLALVCTAGWTATPTFPERVMQRFSPRAILLSHWDNFLRPLEEGTHALPAMRTDRLIDRLTGAGRDVLVGTLPVLGTLQL